MATTTFRCWTSRCRSTTNSATAAWPISCSASGGHTSSSRAHPARGARQDHPPLDRRYNTRRGFRDFEHGFRIYADRDDTGLLICTWPRGGRPEVPVRYCDEVWTGIEYQVAAHCIWEGMVDEGLEIVAVSAPATTAPGAIRTTRSSAAITTRGRWQAGPSSTRSAASTTTVPTSPSRLDRRRARKMFVTRSWLAPAGGRSPGRRRPLAGKSNRLRLRQRRIRIPARWRSSRRQSIQLIARRQVSVGNADQGSRGSCLQCAAGLRHSGRADADGHHIGKLKHSFCYMEKDLGGDNRRPRSGL